MSRSVTERRWEDGTPHHPRAELLIRAMAQLDTDDVLGLKFGGDGDNGEDMIYLLSEVLEREEKAAKRKAKAKG